MTDSSKRDGPRGAEPKVNDAPRELARAAEFSLERKARDVISMDLRGISTATDWFLLATGNSDIQVKAIAEHILEELRKEGVRPNHVEGLQGGRWVLLDFVHWVAHIFHPTAREFYQLERLWGDAPVHEFADASATPESGSEREDGAFTAE
jgi:ribosome-associated protein